MPIRREPGTQGRDWSRPARHTGHGHGAHPRAPSQAEKGCGQLEPSIAGSIATGLGADTGSWDVGKVGHRACPEDNFNFL